MRLVESFTISNYIIFSNIYCNNAVYRHYINGYSVDAIIILLIGYGIISDYLDGFVARKTNTISEIGKMIDPILIRLQRDYYLFIPLLLVGFLFGSVAIHCPGYINFDWLFIYQIDMGRWQ